MSGIGKLLGLFVLSKAVPSKIELVRNILADIAVIIATSLLLAMLAGSFILCVIYQIYKVMLIYAAEPYIAILGTGAVFVIIIGILVYAVIGKINVLKEVPDKLMEAESPVSFHAHNIAESFLDGLFKRDEKTK